MRIAEIENFRPAVDTSIKSLKLDHAIAYYQMDMNGIMQISSIRVPSKYRKQGYAKAILSELCRLADKKRVVCKLAASPLDSRTSTLGLIKLYQQFGFELTGEKINMMGDPWMIRNPKLTEEPIKWAMGKDSNKAEVNRYVQNDPEYIIVQANIVDLFKYTTKEFRLDLQDPKGGPNAIGNRIPQAIKHWQDGNFMDPSEINVNLNNYRGPISFTNGRHRLVAAYQLGHQYAPVIVPKSELLDLEKIVKVRKTS